MTTINDRDYQPERPCRAGPFGRTDHAVNFTGPDDGRGSVLAFENVHPAILAGAA